MSQLPAFGAGRASEPRLSGGVPIELAVQEPGLRLQPARGPVQVSSIERVERPMPD